MLFGAHTSTAGGLYKAFEWGTKFGCEPIQVFTKSQLQWKAKEIEPEAIEKWFSAWEEAGKPPVLVHDSYLINLSSPEPELRQKSVDGFVYELERAALLGIPWVNTHPGSHKGSGEEVGLKNCAASLKEVLARTEQLGVGILLETTAGQGGDLGAKFEHLGYLIGECKADERMGVCVDTCHIFAAGYDLRTADAYKATWKQFDEQIGLKYLRAFHLNDSKFELGKHRDRHAAIGQGFIGESGFKLLATDARFAGLPGTTELPEEDTPSSIATLKRMRDE
ncbi:MAG: deoxyribonuclease IV [bacterium]|nr:deoxyribonuclease IV [bacterium]